MRDFENPILLTAMLAVMGCAASAASRGAPENTAPGATPQTPAGVVAGAAGARANLAGARCHGTTCTCRNAASADPEDPPPTEGRKRFEIRIGAGGGPASLTSPSLGQFASGPGEACFTIDVVPGTTHEVTYLAHEARPEEGLTPELEIAEYGPTGPWWYDVLAVRCDGPGGRCNRDGADAWSAALKTRQRGRIDPCGSTVVSHLVWDTTGGTGNRELGIFQDFTVKFTFEVKKFATKFKPHATECVPK
jgi:hypothetical protein